MQRCGVTSYLVTYDDTRRLVAGTKLCLMRVGRMNGSVVVGVRT